MKNLRRLLVGLSALVLAWALVPDAANATPAAPQTLYSPSLGAVVDQPVFTWKAVDGASYYQIEVALDDQFVTLTDPPLPTDPTQLVTPVNVYGTQYVPLRTYQAKTLYWHVRTISNGVRSAWTPTAWFTRQWTADAEPAGQEATSDAQPARVTNVHLIGDGDSDTAPINDFAIGWDAVPGAAYYEVQISTDNSFQNDDPAARTTCRTTHTTLAPAFIQYNVRRPPSVCPINTPGTAPWSDLADWTRLKDVKGEPLQVSGSGIAQNDTIMVRYPPSLTPIAQQVISVDKDAQTFRIGNGGSGGADTGKLQWYKVTVSLQAGNTYYARVRAVDFSADTDYPWATKPSTIFGMWSDHRPQPEGLLTFTLEEPIGSASLETPMTPKRQAAPTTDVPMFEWNPTAAADAYRVVVAIDREFTDIVASYETRSARFLPPESWGLHPGSWTQGWITTRV